MSKLIILHQIVCQFQLHRAVKKKKKRKFKCNRYLGKAEGQTGEEQTLFPVTHIFFSIMVYRRMQFLVLTQFSSVQSLSRVRLSATP